MGWTTPGTAVSGTPITASFWNTSGRDNLNFLHDNNGNEILASRLLNVTSAGDAGNRSDDFLGSSLSGWTQEGTAPASSTVAGYSALSVVPTTTGSTLWTKAYTPTGALDVQARVLVTNINSNAGYTNAGIIVEDASVGDTTGNGMLAMIDGLGTLSLYSRDTGAYTLRASLTIGAGVVGTWTYIALSRSAANVWFAYWSPDRSTFLNTPGWTKSFTAAKLALRTQAAGAQSAVTSFDFVDVVQ